MKYPKGFKAKKGNDYSNREEFTYATVERGDIKRVEWLKSRNVDLYKVIKRDKDGLITEVERI